MNVLKTTDKKARRLPPFSFFRIEKIPGGKIWKNVLKIADNTRLCMETDKKGELKMTVTETKKLDELISKLNDFFGDPDNFDEEGDARDDASYDISGDVYDTLVYDNTGVPYSKIAYMDDRGYEVVCLERDSFGWLLGGISKVVDGQRRLLTFG